MGLYIYQDYRKAFYKSLEKLNENQMDLIFYIYSKLKIKNFNSNISDARLEPYEPLILTVDEIFKNIKFYEDLDEILTDLKDLIENQKFMKKISGIDKGNYMSFLDEMHYNHKKAEFKLIVSPILFHIIVTEEQLDFAIKCGNIDTCSLELLRIAMFGVINSDKANIIECNKDEKFQFV